MAKKALLTVDGTYRKIKKGFLTLTTLTNLLPKPSAWTLDGVSVANFDGFGETFVFSTGGLAMASVSLDPAIAGHKYYARCAYMTDAGFSCGDGRFEYYYTDGENMVFQTAVGNDTAGAVVTESAILSLASVTSQTGWQMRNFVVNGTTTAYRTQPILIDLTAACGAGNEPSKQWCDANIPYFVGTIGMKIPNVTAGVYRKIKKAFMTVGGVYRPCWSGGELAYYGTITPLSDVRHRGAAASNSSHAIFAGGEKRTSTSNSGATISTSGSVDAYDNSLTKTSLSNHTTASDNASATAGETIFFAGGDRQTVGSIGTVYAYDSSLTRTSKSLSKSGVTGKYIPVYGLGGATVGEHAVFAGGCNYDDDSEDGWTQVNAYAYAYDSSFTLTNPDNLYTARYMLAATSVGHHALFAGGQNTGLGSRYATVDTYDTSLTKGTASDLSQARGILSATTVGKYAIFAGGQSTNYGTSLTDAVDVYDESLTKVTVSPLSVARRYIGATTLGGFAMFAGGYCNSNTTGSTPVIDIYDESLTRTNQFSLAAETQGVMATTLGNFALFGGGTNPFGTANNFVSTTTVEAFTIA